MKGFGFLEIIIVLFVLISLFYLGLNNLLPFYQTYLLENEKNLVINILNKSRLEALSNYSSLPRGVYLSSEHYIIFSGDSFENRNPALDVIYPKSKSLEVNFSQNPIIFKNLSGKTNASATITLKIFNKQKKIILNNEGGIDFE